MWTTRLAWQNIKALWRESVYKAIHQFLAEGVDILSIIDLGIYLFMVNLLSKWEDVFKVLAF